MYHKKAPPSIPRTGDAGRGGEVKIIHQMDGSGGFVGRFFIRRRAEGPARFGRRGWFAREILPESFAAPPGARRISRGVETGRKRSFFAVFLPRNALQRQFPLRMTRFRAKLTPPESNGWPQAHPIPRPSDPWRVVAARDASRGRGASVLREGAVPLEAVPVPSRRRRPRVKTRGAGSQGPPEGSPAARKVKIIHHGGEPSPRAGVSAPPAAQFLAFRYLVAPYRAQ